MRFEYHRFAIAVAAVLIAGRAAQAGQTSIGVAANFTEAAKEIGDAFEAETGHDAVLSFGSTGQLYTQISQGAPFEVFLAADALRPARAVSEGYGVDGTAFTYAVGRIVLWSADADLVNGDETLTGGGFDKIAIANPETAPYGTAAVEAMIHGVGRVLRPGGLFLLYGPFNYDGAYTSESNARFDAWLKQRDPAMGIRDLGWLTGLAANAGLALIEDIEMPVNNRTLVWQRCGPTEHGA